jgi:Dolichyl-phosphate-mannose-protein mannosyltransferase
MPIIPEPTRLSGLDPIQQAKLSESADNKIATARGLEQAGPFNVGWRTALGIVLVSSVYFTDIFLKASHKCFWFDELFSVYLCRLPTFTGTWSAVMHGADFNPPLFYLLTRGAERLFGEGLIATRLPEMVGFWLFCICLFLFVSRRAGAISGFIAGAFPFFTLAKYYANEARASGIVLGWCGLALLCWQRNAEGRARYFWLAGFGLSLLGALLTHVYAVYLLVPFAIVEIYNLIDKKRPNWGNLAVMASAFVSITIAVYIPLFRAYQTNMPAAFMPASYDSVQNFLTNAIGPAAKILLFLILILAANGMRKNQHVHPTAAMPPKEMVLAAGFVCIPLIGLIGCRISHGPFLDRYFLASIAGYAIFAGFASSRWLPSPWIAKAVALCMFLLMLLDLRSAISLETGHAKMLFEPSSGFRLTTTPSEPMQLYHTLSTDNNGLDILVLSSLDYLYFFTYAPPSIVSHLYFGAPTSDVFYSAYDRLAKGARIDLKITPFDPFLAAHRRFLLYESGRASIDAVQAIARAGYRVKSARADVSGILYEYEK